MIRNIMVRFGLTPLFLLTLSVFNVGADVISYDFTSQPPGTRLLNPAGGPSTSISDGVLKISNAGDPGGFGGFAIGPFDPKTLSALHAQWKSRVGGGGGGGADGYSFNIGSDLADDFTGEEGTGTGLSVTVDTFDNGAGLDPGGTGIQIKYGGAIVAFKAVPKDNDGSGVFLRKDTFVNAEVNVTASGGISFIYDGIAIAYQIPAYTGIAYNQINFGGRTGGANDNQWIDLVVSDAGVGRNLVGDGDPIINK